MFVVIWIGPQLQVHYQQSINPGDHKTKNQWLQEAEWAWGPTDGTFLVPCTEAHALAMITNPRHCMVMEVGSE